MAFGGYCALEQNPCIVFSVKAPFTSKITSIERMGIVRVNFSRFLDGLVVFCCQNNTLVPQR